MKHAIRLQSLARAVALAVGLTAAAGSAMAQNITLDGKLDQGPGGYQYGWNIPLLSKEGQTLGNATLWTGENAVGQFLYLTLPTNYVDNTYGTGASSGWGSRGHTFSDLVSSDSATLRINGKKVEMDYLSYFGCKDATSCYKSGTLENNYGGATAFKTSMDYNLRTVERTFQDPNSVLTNSPDNPSWLNYVGYEVQLAKGTINIADPNIDIYKAHASPSMVDGYKYGVRSPVPEPSTYAMMGLGLALVSWYGRRRGRSDKA